MIGRPETARHLQAALHGASLRQSAIANNIANMNTPGYRRQDVRFEKLLAEAVASGKGVDLRRLQEQLYRPGTTPVDFQGNDVDLETEVGEMIKNSAMYKTYMRLLGRAYRKMELAIQDR